MQRIMLGLLFGVLGNGATYTSTAAPVDEALTARPHAAFDKQYEPTVSVASAIDAKARTPSWKRVDYGNPNALFLRSQVGLVIDERSEEILYGRDIDKPRPIASLTKLLTAMTLLDAGLALEEPIEITKQDRDRLKGSRSRLHYGTTFTRGEMIRVALVASDNRAAAALARTYPGGTKAMIAAMNEKALELGLEHTHIVDSSGLHPGNVSTGRDLAKLVYAAGHHPLVTSWSTTRRFSVTDQKSRRELEFRNTNSLVHKDSWKIRLSKTGYTSEAGNCLVMRTTLAERELIIVLLNSWGKLSKYGDSGRIRDWLVASDRQSKTSNQSADNESMTAIASSL